MKTLSIKEPYSVKWRAVRKSLLLLVLLAVMLSGCGGEKEYRELRWESKKKSIEIEILIKQKTIDSLNLIAVKKHTKKYASYFTESHISNINDKNDGYCMIFHLF
jgi:hypothetical protein